MIRFIPKYETAKQNFIWLVKKIYGRRDTFRFWNPTSRWWFVMKTTAVKKYKKKTIKLVGILSSGFPNFFKFVNSYLLCIDHTIF